MYRLKKAGDNDNEQAVSENNIIEIRNEISIHLMGAVFQLKYLHSIIIRK